MQIKKNRGSVDVLEHQGINIWRYPRRGRLQASIHIEFGSTQIQFTGKDAWRLRQFLNRKAAK